jgi:hypothetical protein
MNDRGELAWRTSSRSSGGNCVEVAPDGDEVRMRHSKDTAGPVLTFDREVFRDFIAYVKETGTAVPS